MDRAVCWFRRDLRLDDNPAWSAATAADQVVAVFVLEPTLLGSAGPFRRDQLLANVAELADDLRRAGGSLHVVRGPAAEAIPRVVEATRAHVLHANADVSPFAHRRDRAVEAAAPVDVHWHWGVLAHAPGTVLTKAGTLSQVFTPFHKEWARLPIEPVPEPGAAAFVDPPAGGVELPRPDAEPATRPGATGAHERLARFVEIVDGYPERRDHPADDGTSRLSADLHYGTIGPRELIDAIGTATPGAAAFVRQLAWRDWYAHLLWEAPRIVDESVRPEYDRISWRDDPEAFAAWCAGRTGYPLVDAGMRQLSATGWMHNRVRMVVASFLVKDLLIDWRAGERYFRRSLVDGDVAQNVGNWQWVAGTGPDAAPYFRIFNPVGQSRRFDAGGEYIRTWVPELRRLPASMIHAPWEVAPLDLAAHDVVLGDTYPAPIVDHAEARERTLDAYKAAKDARG